MDGNMACPVSINNSSPKHANGSGQNLRFGIILEARSNRKSNYIYWTEFGLEVRCRTQGCGH